MALTTSIITGRAPLPNNDPSAGAELIFTLNAFDTEGADIALPASLVAVLTPQGELPDGFDLWRNTEGLRGTYYIVSARWFENVRGKGRVPRESTLGKIQVHDAATYELSDLLNQDVDPAPNTFWSAITQQQFNEIIDAEAGAIAAADRAQLFGVRTVESAAAFFALTSLDVNVRYSAQDGSGAWDVLSSGTGDFISAGRQIKVVNTGVLRSGAFRYSSSHLDNLQAWANALREGDTGILDAAMYSYGGSVSFPSPRLTIITTGATVTQTLALQKTFRFADPTSITVSGNGLFVGLGTEHIGGSTSYNGVAGLFFDGVMTDCVVNGVVLHNHAGGGIRYIGLLNSTFNGVTCVGIGAAGGIAPLDNNSDFGIGSTVGDTNGANFIGCDISQSCFGVGGGRGTGFSLVGTRIHDIPGQHAVYCAAMSGISIDPTCSFRNIVGDAIKNQIAGGSNIDAKGSRVIGAAFSGIGQSCVSFDRVAGVTGEHFDLVVSGIVSDGTGNYVVNAGGINGISVSNNTMSDGEATFINLSEASNWSITNNTMSRCQWYMINVAAKDYGVISGNIFIDGAINASGDAANVRYSTLALISRSASATTPVVDADVRGNTYILTIPKPTQLLHTIRAGANVSLGLHGDSNRTTLSYNTSLAHVVDMVRSGGDFTATAIISPAANILGRGKRELYGQQSPQASSSTESFRVGDFCWNSSIQVVTGHILIGWVCRTQGAPGIWEPCYVKVTAT